MQRHYYLLLTLLFDKSPDLVLDSKQVKSIIVQSLLSLHGQVGAAIPVDVIRCTCRSKSVSAILRLPHKDLVKAWSALTLLGSYGNSLCSVQVHQVSASLMALAMNSRDYDFNAT